MCEVLLPSALDVNGGQGFLPSSNSDIMYIDLVGLTLFICKAHAF